MSNNCHVTNNFFMIKTTLVSWIEKECSNISFKLDKIDITSKLNKKKNSSCFVSNPPSLTLHKFVMEKYLSQFRAWIILLENHRVVYQ